MRMNSRRLIQIASSVLSEVIEAYAGFPESASRLLRWCRARIQAGRPAIDPEHGDRNRPPAEMCRDIGTPPDTHGTQCVRVARCGLAKGLSNVFHGRFDLPTAALLSKRRPGRARRRQDGEPMGERFRN